MPQSSSSGASMAARVTQPSSLSRYALLFYVLLIVYASLAPMHGWMASGLPPLAWIDAPLPRYFSSVDFALNVTGYLPFGALCVLALYPSATGGFALLLAVLAGGLLSGTMETVQTWLPRRVPSNLDFAANVAGAFAGALLGAGLARSLLGMGAWRGRRLAWFEPHASFALAVILLWPLAQAFPQSWLFGNGELVRQFGWADLLAELPDNVQTMLQNEVFVWLPDASHWLAPGLDEMVIAGLSWFGAGLAATLPMRASAPRVALVLALVVAAFALKALAAAVQLGPAHAFDWLTALGAAGLAAGTAALLPAAYLPAPLRRTLAALAIAAAMLLVNLLPVSPYYLDLAQSWRQGRFVHLNALAQWLASLWPLLALAALARRGAAARL